MSQRRQHIRTVSVMRIAGILHIGTFSILHISDITDSQHTGNGGIQHIGTFSVLHIGTFDIQLIDDIGGIGGRAGCLRAGVAVAVAVAVTGAQLQ